ncbi:MAG: beta-N-acetylhexosaminidase, partial [Anaerolineales bacterium]|nr:beta-N-acetylhexosaminidase [Anaerolineales bacterium]
MQEPVIFPQPQELTMGEGAFVLNGETAVSYATTTAKPVADYLAQSLRVPTGLPLPLQLAAAPADHNIYLTTEGADEDLGEEGYTLHADTTGVIIRANAANGLFYGVQTLRQLLPLAIEQEEWVPGERWEITAVSIRDFPRYPWRGLMLDVGRHLFPVPFIKKFIDTMALHKFNTLHWH